MKLLASRSTETSTSEAFNAEKFSQRSTKLRLNKKAEKKLCLRWLKGINPYTCQ